MWAWSASKQGGGNFYSIVGYGFAREPSIYGQGSRKRNEGNEVMMSFQIIIPTPIQCDKYGIQRTLRAIACDFTGCG